MPVRCKPVPRFVDHDQTEALGSPHTPQGHFLIRVFTWLQAFQQPPGLFQTLSEEQNAISPRPLSGRVEG